MITKITWWERVVLQLMSSVLAVVDVALLYLLVDMALGQTLTWGLLLTAWWILETVHYLDWVSDTKNGLI